MDAGLTSAIVHAEGQPMNRIDPARKQAASISSTTAGPCPRGQGCPRTSRTGLDPLQAFIDLFSDDDETAGEQVERTLSLEGGKAHIVDGEKQGLVEHLDEAMKQYAPIEIINDHLLGHGDGR